MVVFLASMTLFIAAVAGRWTLAGRNGTRIGPPGLKVPPREYRLAGILAELPSERGKVLAPESVSVWLVTIPGNPGCVVVKRGLQWIHAPESAEVRTLLHDYVAGLRRADRSTRLLAEAIDGVPLQAVVVSPDNPWLHEIRELVLARDFSEDAVFSYRVFVRGRDGKPPRRRLR